MKYQILSLLLSTALLSGCAAEEQGGQTAKPGSIASGAAVSAAVGREQTAELEFHLEGETETVPATLYIADGYSLYVPDKGWKMESDMEDGIRADHWESTVNDEVELSVYYYADVSAMVAKERFMKSSGYVFADGLGGELGDPFYGTDDEGDVLQFMVAEGVHGTTYVIAWEYPEMAAEGFGVRLGVIADTFELTE